MASLKTTINLDSTTLFPNPLALKSVDTENISADVSSLVSNQLQPSGEEVILSTDSQSGDSGIMYFYCKSLTTNSNFGIDIYLTHNSDETNKFHFARLLSGNAAFLPIYAADLQGFTISVKNNDPVNLATVQYFYGAKE